MLKSVFLFSMLVGPASASFTDQEGTQAVSARADAATAVVEAATEADTYKGRQTACDEDCIHESSNQAAVLALKLFKVADQQGLGKALAAKAGLMVCGMDGLARTLDEEIAKIGGAAIANPAFPFPVLTSQDEFKAGLTSDGLGKLVALRYKGLQGGYLLGYAAAVGSMLTGTSAAEKRTICDMFSRKADEVLSNAGKPGK